MYHPSRGGVRGGRDQFKWDDVKVDKHRENYLGHSINAPVGRWQKGKDLFWYTRDKHSKVSDQDALKAEIQRIKEEEEQSMREALGLAPKRSSRPQGNRLDKHEFMELIKPSSTAEDLGAGHAEAAQVQGLGFSRGSRNGEMSTSVQPGTNVTDEVPQTEPVARVKRDDSDAEDRRKKRKHDDRKREKHDDRKREKHAKRDKRHPHDSDDKQKRRKEKEKRRHDSD